MYEIFPLDLGDLKTSLVVPPLLGVFYVVLGSLFVVADSKFAKDPDTQKVKVKCQDPYFVMGAVVSLSLNLELSAWLYSHDVSFAYISAALAVCEYLSVRECLLRGLAVLKKCF